MYKFYSLIYFEAMYYVSNTRSDKEEPNIHMWSHRIL